MAEGVAERQIVGSKLEALGVGRQRSKCSTGLLWEGLGFEATLSLSLCAVEEGGRMRDRDHLPIIGTARRSARTQIR